jgi:hypothetical protein
VVLTNRQNVSKNALHRHDCQQMNVNISQKEGKKAMAHELS